MESQRQSEESEREPLQTVDQYAPPKLTELGTFQQLTQNGPVMTAFDGVEFHS